MNPDMKKGKYIVNYKNKIEDPSLLYCDWIEIDNYSSSGWENSYDISLTSSGLKNTVGGKMPKKRKTKSDTKNQKLIYHSKGVRKKLNNIRQK